MSLPRKPFGSVCHLVNGKAFKPTDWSNAGVPIIRIQNLNGSDKPFNHWAGALDKQVLVKKGDLLLAWSGTPGTSFGAHIWSGPNGILNQHIFRCDLDQKAVTKEWARIAVNHRLHRLIEQAHGGVGLQHVTRGMVEELEIPLPPLAEQRRIAEVLNRAEALRAKRRAALAQLDSLTQSLFLDLFGDPVSNRKGFPVSRMGDVCDVRDGTHNSPKYVSEGGYPLVTSKNLSGGFVDLSDVNLISEADYIQTNKRSKVDRGDIIMPMIGTIGSPVLVEDEPRYAIKNVALIKFTAASPSPILVRHLLSCHYFDHIVGQKNRGGTQKFVSLGDLRSFPLPLPPITLQREFARRVTAVEALKTAQRASLAELDALFATLQHRAFRGEL